VPAEIASANRILLLEKGQIVEDGTPKKLMTNENSKTYKRLKKYKALFLD
jgi:ABC-type multidrug transport system fused ATPase/permease subunit